MGPALLILLATVAFIFLFMMKIRVRIRKQQLLYQTPPPPHWFQTLEKTLPMIGKLTKEQWKQLSGYMQIFLAEKRFEGCGGLEITEEIKITVAAEACMLLLGRETAVYPKLKTVILYPHTYTDGETARLGESWNSGVVVLSWNSVLGGARNFEDGQNVVFHEFAHQLDQEDGAADGAPILEERSAYSAWARVFNREYNHLVKETNQGHKDVMDQYGATNPAEFFAVATETFFEKPRQLQLNHPELYRELQHYYHVEPVQWI
ncbi:zinc-dependent peptidase [Pontiellaceae bacterium B12219]|nr:zinc-dependent peptidase [Pontiellaceae bacterium B12219]